jgi:hypothetical protein
MKSSQFSRNYYLCSLLADSLFQLLVWYLVLALVEHTSFSFRFQAESRVSSLR